jgi:hypothetical protein
MHWIFHTNRVEWHAAENRTEKKRKESVQSEMVKNRAEETARRYRNGEVFSII